MTPVVGGRQGVGEVIQLRVGILFRIVERIDLDDGGEKLLDEEPDFLAASRRGDEFAAGDGIFFADDREDEP